MGEGEHGDTHAKNEDETKVFVMCLVSTKHFK